DFLLVVYGIVKGLVSLCLCVGCAWLGKNSATHCCIMEVMITFSHALHITHTHTHTHTHTYAHILHINYSAGEFYNDDAFIHIYDADILLTGQRYSLQKTDQRE